jgi:hypothetical protein
MLFLFIINNEIIHRFWDSVEYTVVKIAVKYNKLYNTVHILICYDEYFHISVEQSFRNTYAFCGALYRIREGKEPETAGYTLGGTILRQLNQS